MIYHYDLHCHTSRSLDSPTNLRRMVRVAKKRGIDGIAVTDHNRIYKGPLRIEGVDIIPGNEVTLKGGGHLLAYFVTEKIKSHCGLRETVEEIKRQGGYAILAHPLRNDHGWIKNEGMNDDGVLEILDGLESGNATTPEEEMKSVSDIAERAGIIQTAGSDAHMSGQVGLSVVATKERITKENFIEVVKNAEIIVRPEAKVLLQNGIWYKKKAAIKIIKSLGLYNIKFTRTLFFVFIVRNYFRYKNRKLEKFEFNFKKN